MLFNINETNGDADVLRTIQYKLLHKFPDEYLVGAEFGVAFGGGIEQVCKAWEGNGFVYGFDTFEGHPKQLANEGTIEADCMDGWYIIVGKEKYSYEYISSYLLLEGHRNFSLHKGLITKNTTLPFTKAHYVLLDLDILQSMQDAYELVKDKLVTGGYLCLHDVYPSTHMPRLFDWWRTELKNAPELQLVETGKYLLVYKKV